MEIERKYLVCRELWLKAEKPEGRLLIQGYLCRDDQKVVRVRIAGHRGYLTIKGRLENLGRSEFEYEIPEEEARELLSLTLFPPIEKTRYKFPYGGKNWDVDIFHGANEGLLMAEIELDEPGETIVFPEWVGQEVSHDPRYYNSYLAEHPFNGW